MRRRLIVALLVTATVPFAAADPALAGTRAAARPHSAQEGSVSAAALLAKVTSCSQISNGKYKTDDETSATIPVCGKNGAVFWKADMDIDCDGQVTTQCNADTDPWFQDDTAFQQSNGKPLSSAALPYVVVPSASSIWKYSSSGIKGGGIVAVIYNNKVEYAVVGDTGPTQIIGEASYATAQALGIDPDPEFGGADSGVTYILFQNSQASPIESHSDAVTKGQTLAQQFINSN
ncbi:glycoside hydrolase family 75 protein [Actinacidiphila acididurans]|uniref:Glycoside hydrolase family 75 protein n=1 Tax=Actinacidiphila acididurans TaxID=2784346 RepID=A0ABS2U3F0_9ACTN|nr:glycoside hydrolase family 75 protein [Actinacidiphila acididurans]MBM9510114.1 glycoside hydrolase family 75 protein [Actinacidiphila acididurans]